jgi:hypothetical protein
MNQLKGFVFVLSGLAIMITLVSLLMPSNVMTVRSVVVHGDANEIFAEVKDLKKWKDWHPVFMNDSSHIAISEPSFGKNAMASWVTNGKENRLKIIESGDAYIKSLLMRDGENDMTGIISVNQVKDSSAQQVEWRVLTKLKWYPWEKFYGIFIDKLSGPGYEMALNNLRQRIEGNQP